MTVASPKNCRVCGATGGGELRTVDAVYNRCQKCGTLQKQMTVEQYHQMAPGYDPGAYLEDKSEDEIRRHLDVDAMRDRLAELMRDHGMSPAGKRFLDIGCGMGGYLLAARDLGMEVMGFEPSENHGNVAANVLKLPIVRDYFSSSKVLPETFDVVFLSHVIEHIYDPATFVADLVKVLRPGGLLAMVTPNADSIIARLVGKEWPMLVPIDHVTMLAPRGVAHITPKGYIHAARTFEYPYELLATLASIAKRAFRGRATNYSDVAAAEGPKLLSAPSLRSRLLRAGLTAANFPFHLAARLLNRQAALLITISPSG